MKKTFVTVTNLLFILVIFTRVFYILITEAQLDGDEAVFGLMAKRVAEGKDFPIFVWKAHYCGTVSVYICAVLYKIFGVSPYINKIVMVCWEIFGLAVMALLFKNAAVYVIPAIFMFLPSETLRFIIFSGYYGETFALAMLSFYFTKKMIGSEHVGILIPFLAGFVNGFGVYHQPLFLVYFLTILFIWMKHKILLKSERRVFIEIGFILGLLPLIIYNLIHPLATFRRLLSRMLTFSTAQKITLNSVVAAMEYMFDKNIYFYLILSFVALLVVKREMLKKFFTVLFVISFIGFILNFGGIPARGRYLLPFFYSMMGLIILLCIQLMHTKKILGVILLVLTIIINAISFSNILRFQKTDYLKIILFLQKKNIKYAYSNYWIGYPVTFYSNERIIVSPRLSDPSGYHDRYPIYTELVQREKNKCLIFDKSLQNVKNKIVTKLKILKIKFVDYKVDDNFSVLVFEHSNDDKQFLH